MSPPIIGRRNGLEIQRDDVRWRNHPGGVTPLPQVQSFIDISARLHHRAKARQLDGKLEARLRRVGHECRKPKLIRHDLSDAHNGRVSISQTYESCRILLDTRRESVQFQ
jgi:hypothetical protein